MWVYTATGEPGVVAFASQRPGGILSVDVGPQDEGYLLRRSGLMARTSGVQVRAGPAEHGLGLWRIGGSGRAWVELAGDVVRRELTAGQSLRARPEYVGMFDASMAFQVMRVQGVANRYFGGDTHHFAVLSGPGTVWLQSMPLPVFAASLAPYLSVPDNRKAAVEGGVIGGVINDLLR